MKVIVIGGGIGGLTTALSLQAAGIEAEVFESVAAIDPLGLGINLRGEVILIHAQVMIRRDVEIVGEHLSHQVGSRGGVAARKVQGLGVNHFEFGCGDPERLQTFHADQKAWGISHYRDVILAGIGGHDVDGLGLAINVNA